MTACPRGDLYTGPRVGLSSNVPGMGVGEPALDVNERSRHDGPIVLADYDDAWPVRFEREARRIRTALGVRALLVEHAGSTSVPRLAAKPIIDIVLAVPDSAAEDEHEPLHPSLPFVDAARLGPASRAWVAGR